VAIILGGAGGGGGANIPYKGSTAEVSYLPVTQGSLRKLDGTGKIIPDSPVVTDNQGAKFNNTTIASDNGWTQSIGLPVYSGGKLEETMINGNTLHISSVYTNNSAVSIIFTVRNSNNEQLSYHNPVNTNNFRYQQRVSLQAAGEDSQYYLFCCFIQGINSSQNNGDQYALIVKVAKSDNTISSSTFFADQINNNATATYSGYGAPRMDLARNKSVYCNQRLTNVNNSTTNGTLTIATGTLDSNYNPTQVTTSTITGVLQYANVELDKYDDASGNFLLMYCTSTTALVFKKILVAADGSHTVTDVTPSGLTLGTSTTSIRADHSRLILSEVLGKYLLAFIYAGYRVHYQKLSYNGTAITVSAFQFYNTGSTASANYIFRVSGSSFTSTTNGSHWFYRHAEDKVYVTPVGTHSNWSSYTVGAAWTLGSGNVTNTAVETGVFAAVSGLSPTEISIMSLSSAGIISARIDPTDNTNSFTQAVTTQIFSTLGNTKQNIAYVRQDGNVGDTVNISLIEGVTSSDSLSSTYFLNKEDFYYPLTTIPGGSNSVIKSIQRGNNYFGSTGNITISAVDVTKSFINYHTWANTSYYPAHGQLTLVNATTLTFSWIAANNYVQWEVIEYV